MGVKDSDVPTEELETQEQTQGSDNRAHDLAVRTRRNQGADEPVQVWNRGGASRMLFTVCILLRF